MTTTRPMSGVVERPPLDDRLQRVEAVWKRQICLTTPREHARERLGRPLPRCARWLSVIE
jgi:hypothetical protein